MMCPDWFDDLRRGVKRGLAAEAGTGWIVAVSGGSDSVGLLRALHDLAPELGLTLSVAHLNHGVRGEAARQDAAFVEDLARSLGLPCDLGQWEPFRSGHFEADARRARYAWLHQIATARGASVVAVGHTRDDQAETILHRIVRGTGLRGLAGMPAARWLTGNPRVLLTRPLLAVSRTAIRDYLRSLGQPYRDDATNTDLSRTRTRLRHDLLPRLESEYNPRIAEALVRLGKLAAASEGALESQLQALAPFVTISVTHDRIELRRDRLIGLHPFLCAEVIRHAWRQAGWPEAEMTARHWQRLAVLAQRPSATRRSVSNGFVLLTTTAGDWPPSALILSRSAPTAPGPSISNTTVPLEVPGSARWNNGTLATLLENAEGPRNETIDLDRVVLPLTVRAPAPGDRFQPLGMNGQSMALNDFFRGRGVARHQRARTPLLCDSLGVIWVAAHRIADRVKVTEATRRTVGLRWIPSPSPAAD